MNSIYYLWNYKPDETSQMPRSVIINNKKYISNYRIITPNDTNQYINNDVFPNLKELYDLIPHWVIKSDLCRLLYIYFNGGLYCDSDCFIKKKLINNNVVLFTEFILKDTSQLGERECKNPENAHRIANYCFGAIPRHPFIKEVIDECLIRLHQFLVIEKKQDVSHHDIYWICGPDVITSIYHKSKHNYNDIHLHDRTYARHGARGSWR